MGGGPELRLFSFPQNGNTSSDSQTMKAGDLIKAIDADRDAHIAFLQAFVQAPSPNPPGDTRAAADVILKYLTERGIDSRVIAPRPQMPNIVSDFVCSNREGPRLILNGHIDVFPVGDSNSWKRDPWSGEVDSHGQLHGRGTCDMKAGTAASIIAYAYLHHHRQHLKGSLGLTAVSDEETGGRWGSRYLLDDPRWRGDCMLNAEPGGLGTIRFAEKGTLRLTFTVRTAGAHGAYPNRSGSAIKIAARLINELAEVEDIQPDLPSSLVEYLKRPEVRKAIDGTMGAGAAAIMLKPTVNVGTIHGGLKVNMIPDRCVFEADIRLPIGLKASDVMKVIDKILKKYPEVEVSVQEAASNPASSSSHEHRMVDIIERNAKTVTGDRPVAIPSLGATDCKHWRYKNVPAYVYGVSPGRMAMTDESASVDEFIAVLKTHALSAWEYLGGVL